jgi:hypothetical protein
MRSRVALGMLCGLAPLASEHCAVGRSGVYPLFPEAHTSGSWRAGVVSREGGAAWFRCSSMSTPA